MWENSFLIQRHSRTLLTVFHLRIDKLWCKSSKMFFSSVREICETTFVEKYCTCCVKMSENLNRRIVSNILTVSFSKFLYTWKSEY